jgi:hypothetical protein
VLPDTSHEVIKEDCWASDFNCDALRRVLSLEDYFFSEQIADVHPPLVELDLVDAIEDELSFSGEVYELCQGAFLVVHLPVAFDAKVLQLFEVVTKASLYEGFSEGWATFYNLLLRLEKLGVIVYEAYSLYLS